MGFSTKEIENIEFLESCGFYKEGGWLCNPITKEKTFLLGDNTYGLNIDRRRMIDILLATSQNYGHRNGIEEGRKQVIKEINRSIKKIQK